MVERPNRSPKVERSGNCPHSTSKGWVAQFTQGDVDSSELDLADERELDALIEDSDGEGQGLRLRRSDVGEAILEHEVEAQAGVP